MVRVYADGGKVMEREYGGKPTYLKSVMAKLGVGDGYSYGPKKAKRLNIANAKAGMTTAVSNRKKVLDET